MPYQTGTAASASDLKVAIESFAVARGWTLASGVLAKGGAFVRLTATASTTLTLEAGLAADMSGAATHVPRLYVASGWPVTYHLFGFTDYDNIYCVINYNVSRYQNLCFGNLKKIGTWTGGNWASATYPNNLNGPSVVLAQPSGQTKSLFSANGGAASGCTGVFPFAPPSNNVSNQQSTVLHGEIDSATWLMPNASMGPQASAHISIAGLITMQPNLWNSQMVLLPYLISLGRASGKISILGEIPHLRHCRIDYQEPGDVIDIGGTRWKIFPWLEKNSTIRDGDGNAVTSHSGTFGCAILYDGP